MKFLSAIATLAVFTVAQAFQEGPNFGMPKSCSSGTPIFQAHYGSPSIYPMPFCPQAESDYIYILYGTLSEPLVQGTKLVISARVGGKLVYSDTQDYCSLLNVQPQGCTVPANQLVNLYTRVPKKNMPIEGSVEYTYQAVTPDGRDIYCWTTTLSGPKCNPIPTPTTTTTAPISTWTPPPPYPVSGDCAPSGTADQTVTDFNLTPSDYCVGKPYTITTTGSLSQDVVAPASISVSGKYLGRVVYTDRQDLCALLAAAGTPCPVAKTAKALSFALTVKPSLPANIAFTYTYQAINGNNHILFCRTTILSGKNCSLPTTTTSTTTTTTTTATTTTTTTTDTTTTAPTTTTSTMTTITATTTTSTAPTPTATWTPPPPYPVSGDCAPSGTADQTVTDFNLTPSDYCVGKPYTITTTGSLSQDVVAPALISVSGKYLGRVVYTDRQDLCALLAAAGTPCPVAKTAKALSFALTVKPSLPANVAFTYTFQANNGNNHILFCRTTILTGKNCA